MASGSAKRRRLSDCSRDRTMACDSLSSLARVALGFESGWGVLAAGRRFELISMALHGFSAPPIARSGLGRSAAAHSAMRVGTSELRLENARHVSGCRPASAGCPCGRRRVGGWQPTIDASSGSPGRTWRTARDGDTACCWATAPDDPAGRCRQTRREDYRLVYRKRGSTGGTLPVCD